jgi:hypothetical protein
VSRQIRKFIFLSILAFALSACGSAIPDYRLVQLPSGRALKVLRLAELPSESGAAGIELAYETELALDDRGALYREVEAIWDEFRSTERAAEKSVVVIKATTPEASGWSRERTAIAYMLRLSPDGNWQFVNSDYARISQ